MRKQKTLQELTIKDDFLFGAVMQARKQEDVGKRSRYYHSQIVMEELGKGRPYQELPKTFVIFVCDYDPFGEGLFCYTFRNVCQEDAALELGDGGCTIFLSTKGRNEEEVSPELVRFLRYVRADLEESEEDFEDELVKKLQRTVRRIKVDREMGERYMTLEELLREREKESRLAMKQEDILELLEQLGEVPEELRSRIGQLEDLKALSDLHKLAARSDSLCAFEEAAKAYSS